MADTRRRILDTARELFNREGLHRVGVREIARALGVSPGNLAYHFATKDDLVAALVMELHDRNAQTVFADLPQDFTVETLYRTALRAMDNNAQYRFVSLSYVDAVQGSPHLQRTESALGARRRARFDAMTALLARNGAVRGRALASRADLLFEQGEMISSGWIAAAMLRRPGRVDGQAARHYAKLGVALLEPYCTPKGRREVRRVLAGDFDGPGEER